MTLLCRAFARSTTVAVLLAALAVITAWGAASAAGPHGMAAGTRASATARRPPAPLISSTSHPHQDRWYALTTARFHWTLPGGATTVITFAYAADRHAGTSSGSGGTVWHRTERHDAVATNLADGLWYLHVRARDHDGSWSPVSSYALHIDHAPAQVAHAVFSAYAFNPQTDDQTIRLTVRGAGTLHASFLTAGGRHVRAFAPQWVTASRPITLTWNGRDDDARHVPAGAYGLVLRLTDSVGQRATATYWGLHVHYRRIVVSLHLQRLWAFDGQAAILTTLVTTGNRALPTPLGLFHVWGRFHPYTFRSPWPKSSPNYYPTSIASYALYFHAVGYFIHDSPWRRSFGPGTNAGVGTPGQDYTGTHGCVAVPPAVMPTLFTWTTTGTPVQIIP